MERAKIILKSGKDEALKRYHPWVFSGAIKKTEGALPDGAEVDVYSNKNQFLGTGFYQDATIAVRIMSFKKQDSPEFDEQFWAKKLENAFLLRKDAGLVNSHNTNAYRLVHGEGDNMPGLIIDHYNGHLVMQAHAAGIHLHRDKIATCLNKIYGKALKSVYYKSSDTLSGTFSKDSDKLNTTILGKEDCVEILENGHKFNIDYVNGQKTGFFIDQRENRKLLGEYSKGKRVLNTFCYSGGFSVYALKNDAVDVYSLDSSAKAVKLAQQNVLLNNIPSEKHQIIHDDTLTYLKNTSEKFDVIVLDPPAYAKHVNVRHNAVQGYKRLNTEAISKINKRGIIFTFSCSQVVGINLFKSTVISSAINAGRKVRILKQLSQPADHPVNAFHQEGEYLKGLILYVE